MRSIFRQSAGPYVIKTYAGRITLFTLAYRDAMSASLVDTALAGVDPLIGWGIVTTKGLARHGLDGEHITILRKPYARALSEEVHRCLSCSPE
jgi:thioesterase domain-containing protein